METMKKLRRWWLKAKSRRLYIQIMTYDNYNCGHSIQMAVDSYYFGLVIKFNRTMDKLSLIDGNCPAFRFKEN